MEDNNTVEQSPETPPAEQEQQADVEVKEEVNEPAGEPSGEQTPEVQETEPEQPKEVKDVDLDNPAEVGEELNKRGVDYAALSEEYAINGKLSDKSMKALEETGIPKEMVDKSFTKTTRHTGYDLKGNYVKNGRAVYPPIGVNEGVVVAVQLENQSGGMGNTVSVYIPEHGVMKVMHLQRAGLPSVGDKVTQDTPIGYVGNSGAVEKAPQNLHIEFTNEKHEWITAGQFLGMGFKTQKIRDRK